ncbi:hypothetical protein [Pseudomonas veronii]
MIGINRAKAESITVDRLRVEREPLLAELDTSYMRALEAGDDVSAIVTEKQALRDITEKPLGGLSIQQLATLTVYEAMAL